MSWNKEKLRALIAERGEMAKDVGALLLAHERWRGRTEEDYPRETAHNELDILLERQTTSLPAEGQHQFFGLKQLRAYAADKGLLRAVLKSAEKTVPQREQLSERIVDHRTLPKRETERERG